VVILIVAVIAVGAALAYSAGSGQVATTDITVYIDGKQIKANYSEPQTLDWGAIQPLNVYTKNFTVTNNHATQNYTLVLLTAEPAGTTQTWAYNNTVLPAKSYASGTLTLTLSASPSAGQYTWRLLATNGTLTDPAATPTPTPEATPTPNHMLTLDLSSEGIQAVNVTIGTEKVYLTPDDTLPRTYSFKSGTTITIQTIVQEGYIFNIYLIGDGSIKGSNPATFTSVKFDLEVKPTLIISS
jgi:hypothetical protein